MNTDGRHESHEFSLILTKGNENNEEATESWRDRIMGKAGHGKFARAEETFMDSVRSRGAATKEELTTGSEPEWPTLMDTDKGKRKTRISLTPSRRGQHEFFTGGNGGNRDRKIWDRKMGTKWPRTTTKSTKILTTDEHGWTRMGDTNRTNPH